MARRVTKRPTKSNRPYYAPSAPAERRMQQSLVDYDEAVSKLELKWGVDRLPWLAGGELREKFEAQMDKLNKAIDSRSDIEHQVEVTKRGLVALEKAAIANGADPLSGEYFEAAMPDGRVMAVVKTNYDVAKVKRENRELVVYSVDELAMIVSKFEKDKAPLVNDIKEMFPGAVVETVKSRTKTEELLNDEIPF
jgi:hypothetical protein